MTPAINEHNPPESNTNTEPIEEIKSTTETLHFDTWDPNRSDNWEINTMIVRAKTREEVNDMLEWMRQKYVKNIFTISHIAKKEREYFYSVVIYNNPLPQDKEPPVNVDKSN